MRFTMQLYEAFEYVAVFSGVRQGPPMIQLLQLAQGRPVFTADHYAIDAASGTVVALIDHNGGPLWRLKP